MGVSNHAGALQPGDGGIPLARTVALILAGGRVDELGVLTLHRPKSAVFFGGMYRVIDFPLSNLMNSGIERVGILSQYRSTSLLRHVGIGSSWDFVGRNRCATLLPPQKRIAGSDWYKGTTDAVFQNLDFLEEYDHDYTLVLSGDHVYRMDYGAMIDFHERMGADVTAAFVEVPREGAGRFGIGVIEGGDDDEGGRLTGYEEKPEKPRSTWASMTIYLFRKELLVEAVSRQAEHGSSWEFGRDILPSLVGRCAVYGWKHRGYWAYCRSVEEFWRANIDFLGQSDIGFEEWNIRTNLDDKNLRDLPPAYLSEESRVVRSRVTYGCRIEGNVRGCILFPGVRVGKGAVVTDSILFPYVRVGEGAVVEKVIADEMALIGAGARVGGAEAAPHRERFDGDITLIEKETSIPAKSIYPSGAVLS